MNQLKELDEIDIALKWEIFKKQLDSTRQRKMQIVRTMAATTMLLSIVSIVVFFTFNLRKHAFTGGKPPLSIQNLVAGKEPVFILPNGTIIKLDSVPNGACIAPGIPFMKENSTLVYVQIKPKGRGQSQGVNILSVPPRRQYQISLADSSVIILNASSQLHFPVNFSTYERWVAMKGEAYFEVKANSAKPFFVNVKDQVFTKVTGTSFNIEASNENDYIRTSLVEGKLEITEYSSDKSQSLLPGQQANFIKGSFVINDSLNLDQVTAWKEGEFNFDKKSVHEIMQEIGLWYNVKIICKGRMPVKTLTARLPRSMPLSEIVNMISKTNQIRVERIGDTLIVSPKH